MIIVRLINVQRCTTIRGIPILVCLGQSWSPSVSLVYLLKGSFTQRCPVLNNRLYSYPSYRCYFMGTLNDLINFKCRLKKIHFFPHPLYNLIFIPQTCQLFLSVHNKCLILWHLETTTLSTWHGRALLPDLPLRLPP